jgi:3-hydroxyisobutyrate dehydrogenase
VHLGDVGAGQFAKLINNALFTAHLALANEALDAGGTFGLDRAALGTLLAGSSGRSYGVEIVARLPSPGAFARGAALLRKDLGLLDAVGKTRGADARHMIATGNLFLAAVDADISQQGDR